MRLFINLIAIIFIADSTFGISIPVGRSDTDPIYEFSRELYLRGYGNPDMALFGHPDNAYVNSLSNQAAELNKITEALSYQTQKYFIEDQSLNFRMAISPEIALSKDSKKIYWSFYPQLDYRASKNISAQFAYRAESRLVHDPTYMGKKWDSSAGFAELAVISYQSDRLNIDLGRRRNLWGIAENGRSLMLSAQAMPLDGLFLSYQLNRWLSVHSIVAYLSPLAEDSVVHQGLNTDNRYLSAHALRISPAQWLDIVLKESVVYGGPGRRLEFQYAMPLPIYHFEQLNSGNDDNTFFGLETVLRYKNRLAGYCELLLDDYQIEHKTASDREPSEYAIILGGQLFDWPLKTSSWEINFERVANRTYNQYYTRNRYIHQNQPLGYPLGPDNETIKIDYNYHITNQIYCGLQLSQFRQGEGKINNRWLTPWLEIPNYSEKFPSGVVRTEKGVCLRLFYLAKSLIQSKLTVEYADIKNDRNIAGNNKNLWKTNCEITFNLPNLSWRFDHE
jgi:hypothetical protein